MQEFYVQIVVYLSPTPTIQSLFARESNMLSPLCSFIWGKYKNFLFYQSDRNPSFKMFLNSGLAIFEAISCFLQRIRQFITTCYYSTNFESWKSILLTFSPWVIWWKSNWEREFLSQQTKVRKQTNSFLAGCYQWKEDCEHC